MICNSALTYYVPVPDLWAADTQLRLIDKWQESWKKYGWETTVLSEADVKTHPRFDFFNEQFRSKPTEYPKEFTVACFMRYLSASHYAKIRSGCALLLDFDVMCHGFEPYEFNAAEMIIFCDEPPSSVFAGAVLGGWQHFLDLCELFAAWTPDQLDWNAHANMLHQDDLTMLTRMFDSKTRPKPDWFVKRPGCSLYDFSSWRTSKMTHYGFAMKQQGFWPKADFVGKIRPF